MRTRSRLRRRVRLFRGLGAVFGLGIDFGGVTVAGVTLVLFTMASMALAAIVLRTSGSGYTRAALIQGTIPLLGLVLFLFV